jgi:hypothetical protein
LIWFWLKFWFQKNLKKKLSSKFWFSLDPNPYLLSQPGYTTLPNGNIFIHAIKK